MASDLIKRDSIRADIAVYMSANAYLNDTALDVLKMIDKWLCEMEAVDAVPVVRCKNCMYWTRVSERMGKCPFLIGEHQYAGDNHYCSCGERREEDAVD